MIEASVWFSLWTVMPSFASTAWCRPSDQRRPGIRRPVNSSTISTSGLPSSPGFTTYSTSSFFRRVRDQRLVHGVQHREHLRVVEIRDADQLLDLADAVLGERRDVVLLVEPVVAGLLDLLVGVALGARRELAHHAVGDAVDLGVLLGRTGDDERRARFVDQDRVDLVDDRVVEVALDAVGERALHVVAQVVEAVLVVGAVGDVGAVGRLALRIREVVDDDAHREPEEAVDLAHPLGVARGEVVVHGDDVHAAAGQRVQVGRQRRDQRLAFAGLHLGDLAFVQDHAADELGVVVALAERALGRFAHRRERLGQQRIERLALFEALPELGRLGAELRVGELHPGGLERVHALHERNDPLEFAVVLGAEVSCAVRTGSCVRTARSLGLPGIGRAQCREAP